MTTNLTVATANGKRRVAFCNLFFSETNNGKWKRSFTTCVCGVLRRNKHALTCQFWMQFGFSLGGIGKELECNNINSYKRKCSLLIQTLYLWDRDKGISCTILWIRFYIVLLIEKSNRRADIPNEEIQTRKGSF